MCNQKLIQNANLKVQQFYHNHSFPWEAGSDFFALSIPWLMEFLLPEHVHTVPGYIQYKNITVYYYIYVHTSDLATRICTLSKRAQGLRPDSLNKSFQQFYHTHPFPWEAGSDVFALSIPRLMEF